MNSHQNTQVKNIQKVVICSHDRLNENDDTSNFSVELGQQVTDISEFKLCQAIVPLSSYTFNKDDDDKTFEISTAPREPRIRNTSTTPYYFNFAYYTRPLSTYGYGTFSPYELLKPRIDGLFKQTIDAGQPGSIGLRIFNAVSEANSASYLQTFTLNSTINYETLATQLTTFCTSQTSLSGFKLNGIKFKDNWISPNNENIEAQNSVGGQTTFSHPDGDDPKRDVIYFYNTVYDSSFNFFDYTTPVNIGWFSFNSSTSKYDIPISGASITINVNAISTKNPAGTAIYGIRPPNNFSNYDTTLIGFLSTQYTNTTLVAYLNSQMQSRFGITFSKVQNGDIVNNDRLVISSTPNTGYRRIDPLNESSIFAFKRLGYRFKTLSPRVVWSGSDSIGPWENITSTIQPLENINIYYEIKTGNISILPAGVVLPDGTTTTGTYLLSDLIKQTTFDQQSLPYTIDYQPFKINLELVVDTNPVNPGYYSLKMSSPDPGCRRLELRIDDKLRQIFVLSEGDYYYRVAGPIAPEPTTDSTVAKGLIFQPYITNFVQTTSEKNVWFPNPLPNTVTISYRTDTMYTESQLLTDTQAITTFIPSLLFSIVEHKLIIQNTNENIAYKASANERLGIPDDTIIAPLSTYTAVELVDISSLNDVIYIALPDLYQDGKNSFNSFKNLTSDMQHHRPIHSSIVCSIWNNSDVQYGKYVSYNNQADSWMRSTRKDLKTLRIMVLDSEYRIIDLNKKALHLEIDFR
jgi:hypothetical protein